MNNDVVLVETCRYCKREVVYVKNSNGEINPGKFRKEHIRDLSQPTGITADIFKQTYGSKYTEKAMDDMKKRGVQQEKKKERKKTKRKYVKHVGRIDPTTRQII